MSKETQFIKLFVAAERKFLGYLITLLPTVEDAEELMQETSIVIWEKFDEFLATQEGEPNIDRFVAWGCKVAFYKVLNHRRKRASKSKQLSEEVIELISSAWLHKQESYELGDRQTALRRCLEKLPAAKRDLLHDYYWQKQDVKHIAKKNQQTTASVYKLLQRIRISLHKCIEQRLAQ
ncbi:MAG: sigma-70 family RNA polymerase sigma factor [Lacipirellulaceae bacterium]